jgi:hypothetical protein
VYQTFHVFDSRVLDIDNLQMHSSARLEVLRMVKEAVFLKMSAALTMGATIAVLPGSGEA